MHLELLVVFWILAIAIETFQRIRLKLALAQRIHKTTGILDVWDTLDMMAILFTLSVSKLRCPFCRFTRRPITVSCSLCALATTCSVPCEQHRARQARLRASRAAEKPPEHP